MGAPGIPRHPPATRARLLLLLLIAVTNQQRARAAAEHTANNANAAAADAAGRAQLAAVVRGARPLTRAADAAAVPRAERASVQYGGAEPDWRAMRGLPEFPATYAQSARDLRARQRALWPDGYSALCACVRDQRRDLRYWVEYHAWLGVDKFYVFDHNSTRPLAAGLSDYLATGLVELQAFKGRPRRLPSFLDTNQWRAYQACIEQHRGRHRWMGFLDVDEFIVFDTSAGVFSRSNSSFSSSLGGGGGGGFGGDPPERPAAAAAMLLRAEDGSGGSSRGNAHDGRAAEGLWPLYLHQHEHHPPAAAGGLALNWVLYASGGLASRPRGRGPLRSFTACVPREHRESRHFKVAAVHTGHVLAMGGTPHAVVLRPGAPPVVDAAGRAVAGPLTQDRDAAGAEVLPVWAPVALHHYATKSRAEFLAKEARGTGASNRKDAGYWAYAEGLATATCAWAGRAAGEAFEGSVRGGAEAVERPPWYGAWERLEELSCRDDAGDGGGASGLGGDRGRAGEARGRWRGGGGGGNEARGAAGPHGAGDGDALAPLPGTPDYYAARASGVVPRMPDDWLDAKRVRRCFLGTTLDEEEEEERRLQEASAALEAAAASMASAATSGPQRRPS